jgi:quercetin dioxygenase-like cupin family protein
MDPTAPGVRTFYDDWLEAGDRIEERFRTSPGVARDADQPWVRTRHDVRVKRLLSSEDGFPTMGGVVLKAEIPPGWHTGLHRHGEEAIYVETGHGFALIDGQRFDLKPGSVLHIPYRAAHQLVNLADVDLRYVSASIAPLERFVHLFRLEQLEDCGPNTPELLATPSAAGVALSTGRRVVIDLDEAPTDPGDEPTARMAAYTRQHFLVHYLTVARNGFKVPSSVAMTHVFEEPAGSHGGRHQHLEAVLYVIQGEGYSEVGGVRHPWGPGDVLHVPPAMHEHEHSNPGDVAYRLLRIQFGIRYFFQDIWPEGYTPTRSVDADGNPIEAGWLPGRAPTDVPVGG